MDEDERSDRDTGLAAALRENERRRSSRPEADRDHWGATGVDGLDDLGVVDALQVDRRDPEVAVPELALDDDQRHAFVRELDGVGVTELVRRKAAAHAGRRRGAA
jgi:GrpB-like predicted nucleotidyltransferase (UPF0157 family)